MMQFCSMVHEPKIQTLNLCLFLVFFTYTFNMRPCLGSKWPCYISWPQAKHAKHIHILLHGLFVNIHVIILTVSKQSCLLAQFYGFKTGHIQESQCVHPGSGDVIRVRKISLNNHMHGQGPQYKWRFFFTRESNETLRNINVLKWRVLSWIRKSALFKS